MFEEILELGWLAYIGLALLPSPPSPVPDFGTQFLLSLAFGTSAPEWIVMPFSIAVKALGRGAKSLFGSISVLSSPVDKIDNLYDRWIDWISKERESNNIVLDRLYSILGRENLVARLMFGYFCTSAIGFFLILLSVFKTLGIV